MGETKDTGGTGGVAPAAEQRRWPRYPIYLDALITAEGRQPRACRIRDFCAYGLFISFEVDSGSVSTSAPALAPGEHIGVRFSLEVAGVERPFELNARIVRVMSAGLGVELIAPDPVVIAALTQASQTRQPQAAAPLPELGRGRDRAKIERMGVLREVRSRLERAFNQWMDHFFARIESTLLGMSRDMSDAGLQRAIWQHAQVLKEKHASATNELRVALLEHFDYACTRGVAAARPDDGGPSLAGDGLSLVETDEFEQFLAVSEAVDRAETELSRCMYELHQRLTFLFGTRIDKGNNPFGPAVLARRFGEYIRRTRPGSEVLRVVMHAYHDLVIPEIKRFYEDTNAFLAQSGVPLLGETPRPRVVSQAPRRRPEGDQIAGAASVASAAAAGGGAPLTANIASQIEQLAANLPAGAQLVVAPMSAFQAAHTMFGLGRGLQHSTMGPVAADAMAATGGAMPSYTLGEINSALRAMEMTLGAETFSASPENLRANLEQALSAQVPASQPKAVKDTDWDLLELVLEMFNAISKDPRVIPEIKPYLRKLRRPVNMVAMSDKAFFEESGHPARQLINDLARIRSTTKGDGKQSIIPELDFIVDRVASEGADRPELFAEADEKIAALIAEQESEIAANLDELARAAEAQQQFLKTRRKDSGLETRAQATTLGEDWMAWINRVRRLRTGDEIMVGTGAQQKLLRLAWSADDGSSYVFADPHGQRAGSFGVQELAMQLRRGSARIVEDMQLPTVERAMVKSLESLHGRLEKQVHSDELTSLLTEKAFKEAVEQTLESARQEKESQVLALIALLESASTQQLPEAERTERVRVFSERLKQALPEETVAARFPSGEFAVLLKNHTQGRGYEVLEKVVSSLQAADPSSTASMAHARVGMVPFGGEPLEVEQILKGARTALTMAQSPGSAAIRIVHVDDEGDADARVSSRLTEHLRDAMDNDRLKLAYQRVAPQVERPTAALATHLQMVPAMYLQGGTRISAHVMRMAADQLHRGMDLDKWLIRAAMTWVVDHPERLPVNGMCIIALSPASLKDPSLPAFIGEEFINTAAPPSQFCFEIRDDASLTGTLEVSELVNSLREYGCRFMYADFGGEAASFSRVAALKVSLVRIGRMQTRDIVADRGDAALVKSAVEMAHFFGVPAVADCIDSKTELAKLREIGVDYAQGAAVSQIELVN